MATLVDRRQLDAEIQDVLRVLPPEAVHGVYYVGPDHSGEPSVFFRIVLKDEASADEALAGVTTRIREMVRNQLQPMDNWGLLTYFSFRSESDHRKRPDPAWDLNGVPR